MKENEDLLQLVAEEIPGYCWLTVDRDGYITSWNPGGMRVYGYSPEEITGMHLRQFFSGECTTADAPAEQLLLHLAATEGRAETEGWQCRKDGSQFWSRMILKAQYNNLGLVVGFALIVRDLAGQREETWSLMRLQWAVNELRDYAVVLLDTEGRVRNWNQGAERIKGYTTYEIIGQHIRRFYTQEDVRNGKPELLLDIARREGSAADEGWRVRKNGTMFWGSITINGIHDEQGKLIGFSKVTRDLTERKQAEDKQAEYIRQLKVKNKELEQFTYIASHDLQEPLRTVNSLVGILEEDYGRHFDETGITSMRFIREATTRMSGLIKGLLDYSRIGREEQCHLVDCQVLLGEVLTDLATSITQAGALIRVGNLPQVTGYETELRLLFQNLISNAIKFHRPGVQPVIAVNAVLKDNFWEFTVKDNGIGIRSEHFERIFIIFQKLHHREQYDGTGIGLSHCRKIAELHGGRIWVQSGPGQGSSFYFTIPSHKTTHE